MQIAATLIFLLTYVGVALGRRILRLVGAAGNRRARRQDKVVWVKVTTDIWPRLSIVTSAAETADRRSLAQW